MDFQMLYDLLKELKADVKDIREDQISHVQESFKQRVTLDNLQEDVKRNTDNLEIHMKRTDAVEESLLLLKDLHKDNEERIASLEEPGKAKKWLKNHYLGIIGVISATAGAIYAIIKIIETL